MTLPKVHDFWRDPRCAKGLISDEAISVCIPEFFVGLHGVSKYMVKVFQKAEVPLDAKILELGANCGRNLHYLKAAGYEDVFGIEINTDSKIFRDECYPDVKVAYDITAENYLLWRRADTYDVIFTQSVLMHIPPESEWIFREMTRVATTYIITNEMEKNIATGSEYKWDRDYGKIFTELGWKQTDHVPATMINYISKCVTRVFRR